MAEIARSQSFMLKIVFQNHGRCLHSDHLGTFYLFMPKEPFRPGGESEEPKEGFFANGMELPMALYIRQREIRLCVELEGREGIKRNADFKLK